jgi:hypothetical protein
MPEDPTKPLMPRRPAGFDPGVHPHDLRPAEKRKPEKLKPLKKRDQKSPEQAETECLALTEIEQACAIICIEKDKESAAIQLHMSMDEVNEVMGSAPVRLYLQKLQDQTIKELAKVKVRVMRKVGICRATIESRLMELAMLDPERTKGSVDGQVKALNTLATRFGYGAEKDPTADLTPEELKNLIMRGAKVIEGTKAQPVN